MRTDLYILFMFFALGFVMDTGVLIFVAILEADRHGHLSRAKGMVTFYYHFL